MLREVIGICLAVLMAGAAAAAVELEGEQPVGAYPVQIVRPEVQILDRPVTLEVQVDPSLGVDTAMMILCATSVYRGEVHMDRQDVRVRLAISGEIKELSPKKILVSFDMEGQSDDTTGGRGFAGSGAAFLEPGRPKTVLTIGGRSLILTIRFAEQESQ